MRIYLSSLGLVVVLASFFLLLSCSGGSLTHPARDKTPLAKAWTPPDEIERTKQGSGFVLVTLDDRGGTLPEMADMVETVVTDGENDTTVVSLYARDFVDADWFLFRLSYDPGMYKPLSVNFSNFFGGRDDVISLSITGYWEHVAGAIVRVHYPDRPGVSGDGLLCTVTFENTPFGEKRYVARNPGNPSLAPTELDNKVTLFGEYVGGLPHLYWREKNIGDGTNDGDVTIADVSPVAQNYLDSLPNPDKSWLGLVDYSGDNDITIADVALVARKYLTELAGYQVQESTDGENWTAVSAGPTLLRSDADPTPITEDGQLLYEWDAPVAPEGDIYYRVVPIAGNDDLGQASGTLLLKRLVALQSIRIELPAGPDALPLIITEASIVDLGAAEDFTRPQVQLKAFGTPEGGGEEVDATGWVLWDIELHSLVATVGNEIETKGLVTGLDRGFAIVRAISPFDYGITGTAMVTVATIEDLELTSGGGSDPLFIAPGTEVEFTVMGTFDDGVDPDPGTPEDETPLITGIDLTPYVGWLKEQNTLDPDALFTFNAVGTLLTNDPAIAANDWVRVFCQYPPVDDPVILFGYVATSNPIQINFE